MAPRALALALSPALAHLLLGPLLPPAWEPAGLVLVLAVLGALGLGAALGPRPALLLRYTACACLLPPLWARVRPALGLEPGPGLGLSRPLLLLAHTASALALGALETLVPRPGLPPPPGSPPRPSAARVIGRRLLALSRPDLLPLGGAFVFLNLAVIGEMFIPYYTGKVIDMLGSQYEHQAFLTTIFFMFVSSMGSSISAGLRGALFLFAISRLNKRVRNQLFTSLVKQEIGFFEAIRTGDITSRLSTDTALMSRSIGMNVNVFLRSLVKTIGMLSFMFTLSWQLTLLMFIESPLTVVIQKLYNQYHMKLVLEVQDSIAKSNHLAGEIVSSIRTVRSFGTEDEESELYEQKLQETHQLKTKRDIVTAVYLLYHRHVQLAMQVIMLYCGQYLIRTGQMTSGSLIAFILYQMDFGVYVRNVSFELRPGEITALVGPSGGGKTTCVCLLERFYQLQSGQILLDGKPIEEYEHKYYHNKLGLVGQEPVLFALSVQGNICYGLQNSPITAVTAAAKKANAHGFIERMEHGYNTDVGEAGGQLSAGQKQRIAIARALIREPQILILDEATSSLDLESEHLIQQALSRGTGQTILVIAHRLETVEKADKIIVIDNGRVMEMGNHRQLMQQEGCYFRLVQRLFTNGEQGKAE
uniref:ABC-type oligopeptide transporter ABCB9-like isoform X2 n=1 Tax=Pristiophorus japonicus TaxID=55135 RepID=UPI00398EB7DB